MSYQLGPSQEPQQQGGQQTYAEHHHHHHHQQQYNPAHSQSQISSPANSPQATRATTYHQDGIARTQTWVSNQQPMASPLPVAKTPFSEWTGSPEGTWDYRTQRGYSPTMPLRPQKDNPRICGIRRNTFFIVLAIGLFLLVVAIAAGLGVGLATRKNSSFADSVGNPSDISSSSSSSVSPTTTIPTSTAPSSTKVSPTPSFTGTLIPGPVTCPQNNNTVYVSRGSSKPFNVQCGRDYNSDAGAEDLTHMYQASMAQCIDACGNHQGCVGVGWGNYEGSTECWLKSKLGKPNPSPNWYFALLQDMDLAGS
ncbi:hypothetical protein F5Y11DRAFT_347819 [Daldinia sp. FL1419]|nr:hypothetical protein F5Y11DRAFT_347819 [Daldinia sp. FL1419]